MPDIIVAIKPDKNQCLSFVDFFFHYFKSAPYAIYFLSVASVEYLLRKGKGKTCKNSEETVRRV